MELSRILNKKKKRYPILFCSSAKNGWKLIFQLNLNRGRVIWVKDGKQ